MKLIRILILSLIYFSFNCADMGLLDKNNKNECPIEDAVKTKELAESLIVGKWNWLKTTQTSRGTGETILTPESENKEMIFEFTSDKLKIITNGTLTEERKYHIQFMGEGTNAVDESLVVVDETGNRSILFLNKSGNCLSLVNSYNDAGGDLNFVRANK